MHHACSGDLDRRGKSGEILTMTVEEYLKAGPWQRAGYRIYRHPFVLFGIGAFYHFVIGQRFTWRVPKTWKKERRGIHVTNAVLLCLGLAMAWLIGPWKLLLIEGPVVFLAAGIGVWLFYMQHQYEDAFWARGKDWDFVTAALSGSSYYRLPKILQWFTANIGLHHIHHLDARIPNYRLQPCYDAHSVFQQAHEFCLRDSIACVRAKLWDEDQRKMVGFDAVPSSAANDLGSS
jgi:omega-6 fatty acid desaturase (delta-12 desaturase)